MKNRIRELREARNLSMEALGQKVNSTRQQIYKLETGRQILNQTWMERIGKALGVEPWDLITDRASNLDPPEARPGEETGQQSSAAIEELDVRAGMGNGQHHEVTESEKVVAEWRVPRPLLKAQTSAATESLKIITVYGDSMAPDFLPGERVMVDTSDRVPTPPGVFVIWDGFGLVVKRLEMVAYSDPAMVRLISRNKEYETQEHPAETVHINGRVIGKWLWT